MSRKKTTIGKNNLKKIGGRIKCLWKSTGLNQTEFGKSIGISRSSVSDLVRGLYPPSNPTLLAIQLQYSVKPDAILTGEGFCLNKIKKYRSTKEELGRSTIYEHMDMESAPPDPIDQIMQGFAQLFKDQNKKIADLYNICEDILEMISAHEKKGHIGNV